MKAKSCYNHEAAVNRNVHFQINKDSPLSDIDDLPFFYVRWWIQINLPAEDINIDMVNANKSISLNWHDMI